MVHEGNNGTCESSFPIGIEKRSMKIDVSIIDKWILDHSLGDPVIWRR